MKKTPEKLTYVKLLLTVNQSNILKDALLAAADTSKNKARIKDVHTSIRRQIQRQCPEVVTI